MLLYFLLHILNVYSTTATPTMANITDSLEGRLGLKPVPGLFNVIPSQLDQLIPVAQDSSKGKGSSSVSTDTYDDRISSLYSLDDCGTGFEVVKVTEQETMQVRSSVNRIVHGNQTRVPWQVYLRGDGESHVTCGGSLINKQWILTAAHCDVDTKDSVFIGQLRAPSSKEKSPFQIDRVFQHPQYDDRDSTNDFTLIKLKSPVRLTSDSYAETAINPVCLPVPGSEFERIEGWVSGYGHIRSKNGPFSPYLLSTKVSILSESTCNKITMNVEKYRLAKSQFCAAGSRVTGDRGSEVSQLCQGDSGGPLVIRTQSGRYLLIGVVSFAYDICSEPGFFGKVSHVLDWMGKVMVAN